MNLPTLTTGQRDAVSAANGSPVHVVDHVTCTKYVLMPDAVYETLLVLLENRDPLAADALKVANP